MNECTDNNIFTFLIAMSMDSEYKAPPETRIGHVHLKVADLDRALTFYRDLPGFELITMYGNQVIRLRSFLREVIIITSV